MSANPKVLSEVGLVVSTQDAATVPTPSSAGLAGQAHGAVPKSSADKAREEVEKFLQSIDALPEASGLKKLRDTFTEMNNPERTDEEFLSSPDFRNILKLAVVRCRERPSKAKVHIREVVNNMRLNNPKTPEEREKLRLNQQRRLKAKRSSATILEETYLALDKCVKKIRAHEQREESDDDDSNNETNYVYLHRLKKRAVELYKTIQKLQGNSYEAVDETKAPIVVRSTPFPEINRATAKMARRCAKRGMTPDYCDVLTIVKRISEQDDLGMSDDKKRSVASSVFREVIDQMKNRRIKETVRNLESLEIELADEDDEDPAAGDDDLRKRLEQQTAEGQRKIDAVIDKFADKQSRGRTSSDSEGDEPKNKVPKLSNGSAKRDPDEATGSVDDPSKTANGSPKEDDSSDVSIVDERYLETESSENEESDDVDCEEIIERSSEDREPPQEEAVEHNIEPTNSPPESQLAITNGKSEIEPINVGNVSGTHRERQNDVIELSSSGDDSEKPVAKPQPRRVVPTRLSITGRPIEISEVLPQLVHDPDSDSDSSQEVIEISD